MENDAMRLERGCGMDLDMKVLDTMLSKLCSNSISDGLINSPPSCLPIFTDQVVRSKLLKEMPTLDDIDVVVRQVRDASWGVQIPIMDGVGGQRSAGPSSGSSKAKEKVAPFRPTPKEGSRSPSRDAGASTGPIAPSEKKRRLVHSDGSSISKLTLVGQHALSKAIAKQVHSFGVL
jgi:hypothetical protein